MFEEICRLLGITPDLNRLNRLQEKASLVCTEKETWKTNNFQSNDVRSPTIYKWHTHLEKVRVQYILQKEL